jgi:hypothetical protein
MKHIFLIFFLSFFAFQVSAQENDSIIVLQSPAGRLSGLIDIQDLVNQGFNYWEDEFKGHFAGVELGINGFANPDYSIYPTEEGKFLQNKLLLSNRLNLNILQYSLGIQRTRTTMGLVTGLGLSFQGYRLDDNTSISIDENQQIHPATFYFDTKQKSKLSSVYLELPLLFEFQVPIGNYANRMYFSAGIIGAKRLETHTKIKYRESGKKEKVKSVGSYSMHDYKAAATIRMGYRWIKLYASYDLEPLFEDRKGPVLYPFSVGIMLMSF